jgi:hypothetical protein
MAGVKDGVFAAVALVLSLFGNYKFDFSCCTTNYGMLLATICQKILTLPFISISMKEIYLLASTSAGNVYF